MLERPKKINVIHPKETKRFKVLVLGDACVGKSSILDQYCYDKFDDKYIPTIAIDYKTKFLENFNSQFSVQFNFWDMSGNPEFYEVRNEFYRDANGILLVLDVTQKQSLDGLDMWLREANEFGAQNLPTFVVSNKKEAFGRSISETEGNNWSKQRKFEYFEVSAKERSGIDEVFQKLANAIVNAK